MKQWCNIVSTKIPFLKENSWPKKAKIVGESKYGFSEDDELLESAAMELMEVAHSHDHAKFMECLDALIDLIRSKHAPHSLENAEGI